MMKTKITENEIEAFTVELLEAQSYTYLYAPDVAPDSDNPMRGSFEEVLLREKVLSSLQKINPALDYDLIEEAYKQIERIKSPDLLVDNETFHTMLTEGITVERQQDGMRRGELSLIHIS